MTEERKDRLINELMHNNLSINFADSEIPVITEDNIATESMTIKQSICDEDSLKFGGCIASEFTINITSTEERQFYENQFVGKLIKVKIIQTAPTGEKVYPKSILYPSEDIFPNEYINDEIFYVFCGYIESFEMDKQDNNMFKLTAYDVFAKLYKKDATQWFYKNILLVDSAKLYNDVLIYILDKFSIAYNETNLQMYFNERLSDNSYVKDMHIFNESWKNNSDKISYGKIIKDICEMLGLFGFIKSNNSRGEFILLDPFDETKRVEELYTFYEELSIDTNFKDRSYRSITINKKEKTETIDPIFITQYFANDTNYDMTENIVVYMYSSQTSVDTRFSLLYNGNGGRRITGFGRNRFYNTLTATLDGRLWVNIGDYIRVKQNIVDVNGDYILDEDGEITTIDRVVPVLSKTIKGIQALTDYIETKG